MRWLALVGIAAACGRVDFDGHSPSDSGGDGGDASSCNFAHVAAGGTFTCALDPAGAVWCWGGNGSGVVIPSAPSGSVLTAMKIPLPRAATAIHAGRTTACAALDDGSLWCWGENSSGQLGDGSTTGHGPVQVALGAEHALDVGIGGAMACIRRASDQAIMCWGENRNFALGNTGASPQPMPALVAGTAGSQRLAVADRGACIVDATGAVQCWGRDGYSSTGGAGDRSSPIAIAGTAGTTAMAASGAYRCVSLGGDTRCWGRDDLGQLGAGVFTGGGTSAAGSVVVTGTADVAIAPSSAYVLRSDGALVSWGDVMLDGIAETRATPYVSGLIGVTQISAGRDHACAIANGQLVCWGSNLNGQLGRGTVAHYSNSAPGVMSLTGITSIATNSDFVCAIAGGNLYCWGSDAHEQLGDGATRSAAAPQQVTTGLATVAGVTAGSGYACAWGGGVLRCWGDDAHGQLGNGTGNSTSAPGFAPVTVPLSNVTNASASFWHTCAVANGQVMCWGDNRYGQLGDGTTNASASPVSSGIPATAVSVSSFSTCALDVAGAVRCWGSNSGGNVGDGTTTDRHSPVTVSLPASATAIATGGATCALLTSGDLYCWGGNSYGEVGVGDTVPHLTPVRVPLPAAATVVATGPHDTCARLTTGIVMCWGGNNPGTTPAEIATFDGADTISYSDWLGCVVKAGTASCVGPDFLLGNGDTSSWQALPVTVTCAAGS